MNRMEIVVPRASWSDVFFGRHGKSAYSGRPVLNKVPKGARLRCTFLVPLFCPKNGGKFRLHLSAYFELYNNERPHEALGYRTPHEAYFGTKARLAPSSEAVV